MKTNEILKLIGDKEFLDKIYQFSYRRCNTSYEAEDLCSDIILAVISAVHKQEQIENFYAFVWTVARRVYADYCEKRNSVRQTISMENGDYAIAAKENEIDSFIEGLRLTVDTEEDYKMMNEIFSALYKGQLFSLREVLNFLKDNPSIGESNLNVQQRKMTHSENS